MQPTKSDTDMGTGAGTGTRTIRDMCEAFGVTPRTLRFYEARELLSPIRQGQKRLYTRRESARLKLILRGKRFGFALEDIRQLLNMYDRDDREMKQLRRTRALAEARLADMQRQRAALDGAIAELQRELAWAADVLHRAHTAGPVAAR
ncbi:MerR family transcriptional regulator [Roseicitreum antarcticum]|uniref:DNA-binding transcriptional regulator, MerR family n=1 Tax=Roseicitreum antarcticum TaxID=564137 RepID=A0A1H2RIB2_9RHOB|nr:MerR family DNA-binding transcriptional regulator [Roseicitreum antarcticum]SDW18524.1 DNA-binding transcriptional regulator, MerR family [Roseicitreum antarcticum]